MRMPNIKKYISIFIAEDARHADRLIYVLNECRQEVPTILYKISEAYTNSGKDVDRMPSLQEINDGLTKPVEKPIPKPLPPTVSLNTEPVLKQKRTLDEKFQTQLQTNDQTTSSNESQLESSSSSSLSDKSSNEMEVQQTTSSKSSTCSLSPRSETNSSVSFNSTQTKTSSFSSSSASSSTSSFKRFKTAHRPFQNNLTHKTASSASFYQNNAQVYQKTPTFPSYTQFQYSYPPQTTVYQQYAQYQPQPQYYTTNGGLSYANSSGMYNPQQQTVILSQNGAAYPQYYTTAPVIQQQQPQQISIKSEPYDPRLASGADIRNSINSVNNSPYFTNPIPFKQEPSEPRERSQQRDDEKNALNIVSHLLKDKQILNQLEKVAQTFSLKPQIWVFFCFVFVLIFFIKIKIHKKEVFKKLNKSVIKQMKLNIFIFFFSLSFKFKI